MKTFDADEPRNVKLGGSEASDEVLRLRRTVRDLVALSSLPSIWVDCELERSLQNLTDVLRATLRARTVCIRVEMPDGSRFETAASEDLSHDGPRSFHAGELFDEVPSASNEVISLPGFDGTGPINALPHPVFAAGRQIGHLVACFREDVFPGENERLILQVAANQITLLLQRHKAQEERFARKLAEERLRQTEGRLQSLLNLMPAAVYACDADGRITFFNRRAAELWGREPKLNDDHQKFCAAHRCWFNGKVLSPEDTPMAIAVREGKSFRNLEPVFERPDGVRVPVLVNIDPILDANGKPAGAVNVFQDVTALKNAEADLRRKKDQLATFLETAALGLHRVGPDGIIQWANAAEMQMLGYSPEEYIGHHIAEFHADQPVIDDILRRLSGGETLCEREARLRCKDGSIKHVLIDSSVLWEDGKFIHTQCFTRDVTDRKSAEEKAYRLSAIVEYSDDAIFSTDLSRIINSWNRGAERLYGYAAEEVIGRQVEILVPEDRREEEVRIFDRIRRGLAVENYETLRCRKDGSVLAVSLTVSPVKDSQGNIIGASKVARDITEKLHAKEQLETTVAERTASLRKAMAQLEEFSYSVSHDLRAPVRAIEGYARILDKDCRALLPPNAQGHLDKITRSTARMNRLINDVLTLSRVAQNEIHLHDIALGPLIEDIIEQYPEMQAPRASIVLGELHRVVGDDVSLSQAISNLLSNAVKFVAPGVRPEVKIWSEERGGVVRLWVDDNGIGIKPELQSKLFGVFQRLRPGDGYDGTGIGLAIVRKAVERMGGTVGAESDGQNGSRFWIELKSAAASQLQLNESFRV